MMIILNPSPGEVVLIEEPLSWTVNVKSFPTACQVCANYDGDDDDSGDSGDSSPSKGCVRTVGRTPFPSPNHPNAVFCCHSCFAKYRWDKTVVVTMMMVMVGWCNIMTWYIPRQKYIHCYSCQREAGHTGQSVSLGNVWIKQSRVDELSSLGFQVDFEG